MKVKRCEEEVGQVVERFIRELDQSIAEKADLQTY